MLCNTILIIIINVIIYIEGSMCIFIIYIDIIGPLFHFNCIIFKASLIKIINFSGIQNMAHLAMFFIFHVIVIICQNFNLPHIYRIFAKNISFLKWKFSNLSHGIQTWFKLCEMTWFNIPSTFIKIKNHLSFFGVNLCF
jgi:hypothetical protein